MLRLLFILSGIFALSSTALSQVDWNTKWEDVYPQKPLPEEPRVRIQFGMVHRDDRGNFTGQPHSYSWFRTENQFTKPNTHLTFKFDFKGYDGSTGTQSITVDLSNPETSFSSVSSWFSGYEIMRIYDIKLHDPNKDEAADLKHQLDDRQSKFLKTFQEYTQQVNALQDEKAKKQYVQTLNNSVSNFNSAFALAAQYYKNGDGLKLKQQLTALDKIKTDLDSSLNLLHDVVERPGIPVAPKSSIQPASTVTNSASAGTTYNATQAQTQAYINNAQNQNNDAIQNALALNQAKINATKPGGSTAQQRVQIQQVQQQQNQNSANALSQSASELGDLFSNIATQKQNRQEYERKKKAETDSLNLVIQQYKAIENAQYAQVLNNEFAELSDYTAKNDTTRMLYHIRQIASVYKNDLQDEPHGRYWYELGAKYGDNVSIEQVLIDISNVTDLSDNTIYAYAKQLFDAGISSDRSDPILSVADWYYKNNNCDRKKTALQYYLWYEELRKQAKSFITYPVYQSIGMIYKDCMANGDATKQNLSKAIEYLIPALTEVTESVAYWKGKDRHSTFGKADKKDIEKAVDEVNKRLKSM